MCTYASFSPSRRPFAADGLTRLETQRLRRAQAKPASIGPRAPAGSCLSGSMAKPTRAIPSRGDDYFRLPQVPGLLKHGKGRHLASVRTGTTPIFVPI